MRHFPIFLDTQHRRIVVSGAGACAEAKLRLLVKTQADLAVFGKDPSPHVAELAAQGRISLFDRAVAAHEISGAALVYAANDDAALDDAVAHLARVAGVLLNVVDNLNASQFITPAIVDRDPVVIAIGTEGAAPVLARQIKADLEQRLPTALGTLAQLAQAFRRRVTQLPEGRARRDFWGQYFGGQGAQALAQGGADAARAKLESLLLAATSGTAQLSHVDFIAAESPDLLTLQAHRLLGAADIVLHDADTPADILDLARREAAFVQIGAGPWDGAAALHAAARDGAQLVRLYAPGNQAISAEAALLDRAAISHQIIPFAQHPAHAGRVVAHPALFENKAFVHG